MNTHIIKTLLISHGKIQSSLQLVWPVLLAQVLPRTFNGRPSSFGPRFFPSKTWLFRIYLKFQLQKSLKNQYLPHSESKSYQINSIIS